MTPQASVASVRQRPLLTAEQLGQLAFDALMEEVLLTPKPGLIDLRGRHAHQDMSLGLMCRSAHAIEPWFVAMASSVQRHTGRFAQREALGALGRLAEQAMMDATGGINTHRGAIWALGLLVAATAKNIGNNTDATTSYDALAVITQDAANLARCTDRYAPVSSGNKGEAARRTYQVGGAKSQAQAGFPHVMRVALPTLHRARRNQQTEITARLDTLLALISQLDDTCLLARGGTGALRRMQSGAQRVLALGGTSHPAGWVALTTLNTRAQRAALSPGGAADLLAATLYLDRLATFFPAAGALPSWKK